MKTPKHISSTSAPYKFRITFFVFSKILSKEFYNVELHRCLDDAELRARALNWSISKVESI